MKTLKFVLLVPFCIILFLTSCSQKNNSPESIVVNFSSVVSISGNYEMGGNLVYTPQENTVFITQTPKALKGLTFSWKKDEYSLKYDHLIYKSTEEILPESTGVLMIKEVLDQLCNFEKLEIASNSGGVTIFAGRCVSGSFKAEVDNETALVKRIIIGEKNLTADFSEIEEI